MLFTKNLDFLVKKRPISKITFLIFGSSKKNLDGAITTDFVDVEDSDEEPVDGTSSVSKLELELNSDDNLDGKKRVSDDNSELQIE